jgi:3-hydroxyisobutyrate dehydrogenase-like beta-hydroxyacid dehydrogenase
MGSRMAKRLIEAGHSVTGYNRTKTKAQWLLDAGMKWGDTPREVAEASEITFSMVTNTEALEAVALGAHGIVDGLAPGKIYIDMSTVSPAASRAVAVVVTAKKAQMLDAPVSGSVASVEAGTLTVIAGGPRDAFDRARPVLGAFSNRQLWLGPSGAGAAMKLALNGMIAASAQMIAEALVVAELAGIERAAAYDAIAASAVGSPFVAYKRDAFLDESTPPAFSVSQMQKDLALAREQARALGVPLEGVAAADALIGAARRRFGDDADIAAVAAELRQAASPRDATPPHTTPEAA